MAMIISFAIIVAQECHRVVFGNVFWVLLDERLDAVPQRWDCLHILVQAQHEAIFLLVVLHKLEWIIMDIAEQFHAWLNTPVVLKLVHERMSKEEPGFETTHVPVADRVAIDDLALRHIFADLARLLLVNEGRERPVLFGYLAIVSLSRDEGSRDLFEVVVKWFVIQEHPIVVVIPVKSILNLTNRSRNLPNIRVPGKCYEGRIDSLSRRRRRQRIQRSCRRVRGCWRSRHLRLIKGIWDLAKSIRLLGYHWLRFRA